MRNGTLILSLIRVLCTSGWLRSKLFSTCFFPPLSRLFFSLDITTRPASPFVLPFDTNACPLSRERCYQNIARAVLHAGILVKFNCTMCGDLLNARRPEPLFLLGSLGNKHNLRQQALMIRCGKVSLADQPNAAVFLEIYLETLSSMQPRL